MTPPVWPIKAPLMSSRAPWSAETTVQAGRSTHPVRLGIDCYLWPISQLRPTQMAVGWREVAEKRRRGLGAAPRSAPAVLGPKGVAYVLDRHHSLCARQQQGEAVAAVHIVEDLQHLSPAAFWRRLDQRGWCRPYDALGQRRAFGDMPERLADLGDDPFRSLASALRRLGGYRKSSGPFSEFRWADHLRAHIAPALLERDFETAVGVALKLARRPEAASLPGAVTGAGSRTRPGVRRDPASRAARRRQDGTEITHAPTE